MLTVALGMMLCLPLRLINYRDWALMGNDSQQSKPNHHVSEGYNEELVIHMALCGFLLVLTDYELTVWLLWSYLIKHLPMCFVYIYTYIFLCYSSIVISEHWYHQHSWIWQHHPALEWRQEDMQRNRGFHEGQVRSHSHYHLVWHFYLKRLMFSQL